MLNRQYVWNSEKQCFELVNVKEGVAAEFGRLSGKEVEKKLRKAWLKEAEVDDGKSKTARDE